MCGIAGLFQYDRSRNVAADDLRRMTETLAHRGPDGTGVQVMGPLGLGHRRLAIVDLSEDGRQPMSNEDGSVWVVLNGEIYNHQELRAELVSKGHRFKSHSDTEAIVHLWEEEGPRCVERLRGMFAFALWDEGQQTLFLARDRMGEKPLFYAALEDRFVFGSEIKAILASPGFNRAVDIEAVHHYLAYQSVPAPLSAFRGVAKLEPAHSLLVTAQGPKTPHRYWTLSFEDKIDASPEHEAGLCDRIVRELTESVRLRLMSDVPLGAFLSGGIDSSMIVALMAGLMNQPVKTFSIGFAEEDYNELPWARKVAELYRTDHHEFIVTPDARELIPSMVWHYNEPFADSSAIPTFYVSSLAREHVTVALTGDGGDEAFGGYSRYRGLVEPQLAAADEAAFRALVGLRPGVTRAQILYHFRMTHFHEHYQRELYTTDLRARLRHVETSEWLFRKMGTGSKDVIDQALAADLSFYLPDTLMTKVDVASMASSLETRPPFLDHILLEFAARLPSTAKVRGDETKVLLKKAAARLLPQDLIHRRKMGFGVPLDQWFRTELRDFARDTLLSQAAVSRGYFNPKYVESLLDRQDRGESWQSLIWNLLMLELWHGMFIDSAVSPMAGPVRRNDHVRERVYA